jgi:hypothetical protein
MWQVACDPDLPLFYCTVGNVANYCSSICWFLVLLPQLYHNWKTKSVVGLSLLTALSNFTASICNAFFVFRLTLPWSTYIMAVYMPLLEFLMLIQFVQYGTECGSTHSSCTRGSVSIIPTAEAEPAPTEHLLVSVTDTTLLPHSATALLAVATKLSKPTTVVICIVSCMVWIAVVVVEVLVTDASNWLQWCSVVLWSTQGFPQLLLNMQLQSTAGQSRSSVAIATLGKTTDSLFAFLLILPTQTCVLAYFSASTAFLNTVHVFCVYPAEPTQLARERLGRIAMFLILLILVTGEAFALAHRVHASWIWALPGVLITSVMVFYVLVRFSRTRASAQA